MDNIKIGRKGEQIACDYLLTQGVEIIGRNLQTQYGEIDILGKKEGCYLFTEVKTRQSMAFGFPEHAVNAKKQDHMANSALAYIQEYLGLDVEWRIDVIAINLSKNEIVSEIKWFKNAIAN